MKKEKLTLEHLAPYLPYGLKYVSPEYKAISMFDISKGETVETMSAISMVAMTKINKYKPLLYPISKLTQEIEHNGKKFIPIDSINNLYPEYPLFIEDNSIFITDSCDLNMLEIHEVYKLYQKLFEWHFDIFGLIEKGLAIEKQ